MYICLVRVGALYTFARLELVHYIHMLVRVGALYTYARLELVHYTHMPG